MTSPVKCFFCSNCSKEIIHKPTKHIFKMEFKEIPNKTLQLSYKCYFNSKIRYKILLTRDKILLTNLLYLKAMDRLLIIYLIMQNIFKNLKTKLTKLFKNLYRLVVLQWMQINFSRNIKLFQKNFRKNKCFRYKELLILKVNLNKKNPKTILRQDESQLDPLFLIPEDNKFLLFNHQLVNKNPNSILKEK